MTVKAISMGVDTQTGKYRVNVKSTEAQGNIGGAGVIRYFETKEEAKEYIKAVNKTGEDVFVKNEPVEPVENVRHVGDEFVLTSKN